MTSLLSRLVLAAFFIFAGVNHFRVPEAYKAIMPPALPHPDALSLLSGVAEIVGGLGVLPPRTRKLAGYGLILLLLAVFPANIYATQAGMKVGDWTVPQWLLWARLPLQLVLIAWVWASCCRSES
jgi:uncharacterized membrane protein